MTLRPLPASPLRAVVASTAVALVAASFVPASATAAPDPMPTASFGGHDYRSFDDFVTWDDAVAACDQDGGHLVTIGSAEENAFVHDLNPLTWLGATDRAVEGTWVWVTGEPFDYTSWAPGEPNNSGTDGDTVGIPEHGLTYAVDAPYRWNDLQDDGPLPFVCEYETPGAATLGAIRDLVVGFDLGARDQRRLLRWVDVAEAQLDRGRPAAACVAARLVVWRAKHLARRGELTWTEARDLRLAGARFCREVLG